jgi:hypothetical protein
VNNKQKIADDGGIDPLVRLAGSPNVGVKVAISFSAPFPNLGRLCLLFCDLTLFLTFLRGQVEAIAALANLAVNDNNEVEIARSGGLQPILQGAQTENMELQSQAARALRNLSVNRKCFFLFVALLGDALTVVHIITSQRVIRR